MVLHTQPKPGLAEREIAATCSQNGATAEPVPTSAPGQRELPKNYKLPRGVGENLNLNYLGFSGQTFAQ